MVVQVRDCHILNGILFLYHQESKLFKTFSSGLEVWSLGFWFGAQGDYVHKSVFIIFFQGDQLKNRVKKICEGWEKHASPEDAVMQPNS